MLLQEEWQCVELTVAAACCAVTVQRQLEGRLVRWPGGLRGMPASRAGLIIVRGLTHASKVGGADAQSSLKAASSLTLRAFQLALKQVEVALWPACQAASSKRQPQPQQVDRDLPSRSGHERQQCITPCSLQRHQILSNSTTS